MRSCSMTSPPPGNPEAGTGAATWTRNRNTIGSATSTIGNPIISHVAKPRSVPSTAAACFTMMMFGAVPILVPMPPMLAAYAMPSISASPKRRTSG